MNELVEFLQAKAGTGEVITIAYSGGSRPGEARSLIVASCANSYLRAYEENSLQTKQYKIERILWFEDSCGTRITIKDNVENFESFLPKFETLEQYADLLKKEFAHAGWHIHQREGSFGVGTYFKNEKPKKTPSIAIAYFDPSVDDVWDLETNDFVAVKRELTGRERPWRVDSWRFKQGKSFGSLHSAIELFVKEVRSSDPLQTKDMFAGH